MTTRTFILGSNWLYFKIYTGYKTADFILTDIIYSIVENLKRQNLVSHWFFIRYSDPDFHIRVRFYIPDTQNISKILSDLNNSFNPLLEDNLIWNVQFDSYKRELERYGENTMELSEQIFYRDSEFVINLIKLSKVNNLDSKLWLYLLKSIDVFLSDFEYDIDSKLLFMKELQENYYREFSVNEHNDWQFGQNYRTFRKEIEQILDVNNNNNEDNPIFKLISLKSEQTKESINDLLTQQKSNSLEVEIKDLLMSYIHMSVNRVFRSQQRKYELIIYDFLQRYYNSLLKRKK